MSNKIYWTVVWQVLASAGLLAALASLIGADDCVGFGC
jgi:hypothetical protein